MVEKGKEEDNKNERRRGVRKIEWMGGERRERGDGRILTSPSQIALESRPRKD
jgi:hypothetical protein